MDTLVPPRPSPCDVAPPTLGASILHVVQALDQLVEQQRATCERLSAILQALTKET